MTRTPDLLGFTEISEGHIKITNRNYSIATEDLRSYFFVIMNNYSQKYS